MPNEKDSDRPSADAQQHPSVQPELPAPTPEQGKVGTEANKTTTEQPTVTQEMRREFRWFEFGSLFINSALVIVGVYALSIYSGQLTQMQRSVEQTERAVILNMGQLAVANRNAKTAEDTLGELKRGGTDTHTLATAAKRQADTSASTLEEIKQQASDTHELVVEAGKQADAAKTQSVNTELIAKAAQTQATASVTAAEAAKSAASTASNTLAATARSSRIDQRAWLEFRPDKATLKPNQPIKIPIYYKNLGKTTAISAQGVIVCEILPVPKEPDFRYDTRLAQQFWAPIVMPGGDGTIPCLVGRWDGEFIPTKWSRSLCKMLCKGTNKPLTSRLFVYGDILYTDIFRISHAVTFCEVAVPGDRVIQEGPKLSIPDEGPCHNHNKIDSNE